MSRIEDAEKDYLSGMKYKDIAEKYGMSLNTVKSWKSRNGWQRDATKKKGAHKKSKVEYMILNYILLSVPEPRL